jgi:hypothetical protein
MSFSNAPDIDHLGRVAGAMAVDEAFAEKDWYVVQAIGALIPCSTDHIRPVFSGGTSLLKGHGLINRFSEDIDFKLSLSNDFQALSGNQQSKQLRTFRENLLEAWEAKGFEILDVQTRDASRFVRVELAYPTAIKPHAALRSHILAELSAKPPHLPPIIRPIGSFVAQARREQPEIEGMNCVDPLETAVDKLSALSWRLIARNRDDPDDDPTIIRHLYDLAALETVVMGAKEFRGLAATVFNADHRRGGGAIAEMTPANRVDSMLTLLSTDERYVPEYERYVAAMTFAGSPSLMAFEQALAALGRICAAAKL